jgi:hypothetical protein
MPRAGSGWHYNLVHDLVVAGGGKDARQIRRRFLLQPFLTEVNCNIGHLGPHRLLPVLFPVWLGATFSVKTHAGPGGLSRNLIRRGRILPVYIYRDPRAALLSAYEYGQRGLRNGRPNAFSHLDTLDKAGDFIGQYVNISEAWLACGGTLLVRYEDLLEGYDRESARLVEFLGLKAGEEAVRCVVEQYRPEHARAGQPGLHFSQGKAERFREALTPEQLSKFNQLFAAYLKRVGYPL